MHLAMHQHSANWFPNSDQRSFVFLEQDSMPILQTTCSCFFLFFLFLLPALFSFLLIPLLLFMIFLSFSGGGGVSASVSVLWGPRAAITKFQPVLPDGVIWWMPSTVFIPLASKATGNPITRTWAASLRWHQWPPHEPPSLTSRPLSKPHNFFKKKIYNRNALLGTKVDILTSKWYNW